LSNLCAFFVTAHLYERPTTDNEPRSGEMNDMVSFFRNFASGGGRCVACNATTIDAPIDLLITIIPWKGIIPTGIRQQIVSESIPEQREHKYKCSDFKQDTKHP